MRTLNPCDFPVDTVIGRVTSESPNTFIREMGLVPNHPDAADMIDEYRDRSLDEAEETIREETEYWHGMSEVGPEWFFEELEVYYV